MSFFRQPLSLFLCRFFAICLPLVTPWPGFRAAYAGAFRYIGNAISYHESIPVEIRFEPPTAGDAFDTNLVIANRSQALQMRQPVRTGQFDAWDICYLPTALLAAVLLAAPSRWPNKIISLLAGLTLMHLWLGLVVVCTVIHEINQAPELALPLLPGWLEWLLDRFFALFVQLTIPPLIPPLAIAALVGFRRSEWRQTSRVSPPPPM